MEQILSDIRSIIEETRNRVARSINHERTIAYWNIGKRIVEEEQGGKQRAEYGKFLIKNLSKVLVLEYGDGFSHRQLELMRQLFHTFPIANSLSSQLSWTHYKALVRIDDIDKRTFFIAESIKNAWNVRQMERQIHSLLYERLLINQDKESILAIAKGEQQPYDPNQIIKDPTVLEFLGLKPETTYYETEIEEAIITHLQDFLLELGNGFSFVARQKRIIIDGDEFKIDLVFYNRLLQCFVIFDIKVDKITHQDLGQLQMYVNYYDRDIKTDFENPTIGVLLCADKNDAVVRYSLPLENQQIFASKYQLHLPTEAQLLEEVRKELAKFSPKKDEAFEKDA
jgi:predicted nuclease of restriction endonuclease-like (RecB) superfamily